MVETANPRGRIYIPPPLSTVTEHKIFHSEITGGLSVAMRWFGAQIYDRYWAASSIFFIFYFFFGSFNVGMRTFSSQAIVLAALWFSGVLESLVWGCLDYYKCKLCLHSSLHGQLDVPHTPLGISTPSLFLSASGLYCWEYRSALDTGLFSVGA